MKYGMTTHGKNLLRSNGMKWEEIREQVCLWAKGEGEGEIKKGKTTYAITMRGDTDDIKGRCANDYNDSKDVDRTLTQFHLHESAHAKHVRSTRK